MLDAARVIRDTVTPSIDFADKVILLQVMVIYK